LGNTESSRKNSIEPRFISRERWKQRGRRKILEKNDQGGQTLFLPRDLQLWEMVDVIKAVDRGTYAKKPKLREKRAKEIFKLGETFKKAGLYLEEYLPHIEDGSELARKIAREFHAYGSFLTRKNSRKTALTEEDKQKLDEWFLGEAAYQKRVKRLGENPSPDEIEKRRIKSLQVYFGALSRKGYRADGEKPWETKKGPIQRLQEKSKRQIVKTIETPEREMKTAIFRRGIEKLVMEVKAPVTVIHELGLKISAEQKRLYDVLKIPRLKRELERVRKSEDVHAIAKKELEIAGKIQKAVCAFPYKHSDEIDGSSNYPSKIVETQFINCVGASILGGGLLDEVGIKYLHADVPNHSLTFLITSNGKVFWRDFTPSEGYLSNHEVTDKEISGNSICVKDIIGLAHHSEDGGLHLDIKYPSSKEPVRITLFKPEGGLQSHILQNTGSILSVLGRYEEAVEAFSQAISINPEYVYSYYGLGITLYALGRYKEAVEAFSQVISTDPEFIYSYNELGNIFKDLGKYKKAIEAYQQAISIDPEFDPAFYNLGLGYKELGNYKEAIRAFRNHNKILNNPSDPWAIKAEEYITEMQEKLQAS